MSFLAANPAGFSYLSPCPVERANASLSTGKDDGELHPSYGGQACVSDCDCGEFHSRRSDENFALARVCRYVSRLLLGHASGSFRRPAALGLLLRFLTPASQHRARRGPRLARPFGVSVPPETSLQVTAKDAAQTSFEPLRESRPSALGAGPTRQALPSVTRATTGNSTNGDTIMYRTK
jgi:hypothetical protein